MDWLDIARIIGVIIVWICVVIDLVLLIHTMKSNRKIDKCYDEALECLKEAHEAKVEMLNKKELFIKWLEENEHLTSEEN
jgi:hypothetical protein